jgi:protein PhnA
LNTLPPCPECKSGLTYHDGKMHICPECAHEWIPAKTTTGAPTELVEHESVVLDANGNVLKDGDTVMVVKDLPMKGARSALKAGTKVRGIRLVGGDHNIDCKIEGFGGMKLKSRFVKKA